MRTMSRASLAAIGVMLLGALLTAQPTKPIYLQYDGYVRNTDGTLTLSFGYFNMNNVDVTVPPGDANTFTPLPGDRNQPVTFLKGRHRFVCSMVVDRNFDGNLRWTLRFAGASQVTTPKMLDALYELEEHSAKRASAGLDLAAAPRRVCVNRAPTVEVVNLFGAPDGPAATALTTKIGQEIAINGRVEDDGLPRGSTVTSAWTKVSGPGEVTFSDAATAATRVKFGAAGAYLLHLTATDGERSATLIVNVTVT